MVDHQSRLVVCRFFLGVCEGSITAGFLILVNSIHFGQLSWSLITFADQYVLYSRGSNSACRLREYGPHQRNSPDTYKPTIYSGSWWTVPLKYSTVSSLSECTTSIPTSSRPGKSICSSRVSSPLSSVSASGSSYLTTPWPPTSLPRRKESLLLKGWGVRVPVSRTKLGRKNSSLRHSPTGSVGRLQFTPVRTMWRTLLPTWPAWSLVSPSSGHKRSSIQIWYFTAQTPLASPSGKLPFWALSPAPLRFSPSGLRSLSSKNSPMLEDTSVHPTLFLILSPVFYWSPCPGQPRVLCSLPFIWAVWVLLVSCFHCRGARLPTLGTRRRPLRMRCFLSDTVSVLVSNCKGKCIDLVWH